jgi:crotonobetainyl-CoA:carnitine CoA-transferase CaiB-like acyl-CoA transferase
MLPCDDLRVLDFCQGNGALAGMVFADYGADVIKVEPPGGDRFRSMPAFLQWNRGKRGVVLDLAGDAGRAAACKLAASSDVLIQNFRPRVAERLGIGYTQLRGLAPQLVHVTISGFGASGKYADVKGYEGVVAAVCGQFAIQNGYRADGPIYDAIPKCSFGAAFLALIGALAALEARQLTGRGQAVESTLARSNFVYSYTGIRPERMELLPLLSQAQGRDPHNVMPGYRISRCADDRWIQSGSALGRTFDKMMSALGIKEYFRAPPPANTRLLELIDAAYARKRLGEWMRTFDEHDVAYGTFMTTQEFMDHPQVRHNGHVVDFDDPRVGQMEQIGPLVSFDGARWHHPGPAPDLGQHTDEVLGTVSYRPAAQSLGQAPTPPGALTGKTIIDLSMFAAAPGGPGILADLGARVIKVEPPTGDLLGANSIGGNELFFRVNRGKERITVDLKTPEGKAILHRIVEMADVVVHNFRPGVPERLGMDFETLIGINDRLVYVYAASFGSTGPDAHRPAFDAVISAMAGGEVLQAGKGNPPQQRQTTDHSALLGVAVAILLGLRAQRLTNCAQKIETTMLASAAYLFSDDFLRYDGKPSRPEPDMGQHGLHALYRLYRVGDGSWIFLACPDENEWERLVMALGHEDLLRDERFATPKTRAANNEILIASLEAIFSSLDGATIEGLLCDRDIACVRVNENWTDIVFGSTFAAEPQFTVQYELEGVGPIEQTGANVILSETPGEIGVPEPFAASTSRILHEIGVPEAEITDLIAREIVRCRTGAEET